MGEHPRAMSPCTLGPVLHLVGSAIGAVATPDLIALLPLLPFLLLLAAISLLPQAAPRFWHRRHPLVAVAAGLLTVIACVASAGDAWVLLPALFDYASFITVIACLYLCCGGVVVRIGCAGTPAVNLALLLGGAVLSNLVGTTGATLLLIRPYLAINRGRLRPYHMAFFIFLIANIGGCLTPIGDPPLLLGYLRGIDFLRFPALAWAPWLVAVTALGGIFVWFERSNRARAQTAATLPRLAVRGWVCLCLLALALATMFLDPQRLPWLPRLEVHQLSVGFLRECLLVCIAVAAWRWGDPVCRQQNEFAFAPLGEIAWLFLALFITMVPALMALHAAASSGTLFGLPLAPLNLYLFTAGCSGLLDNAPTFLAVLSALEGANHLSAADLGRSGDAGHALQLSATAVGAVFGGALTYIGNGPNLLILALCTAARDPDGRPAMAVPGFFTFVWRFTLPVLVPVLLMVALVCYR
jgi:Na+/H+ antiporter NhaD/arsenite permease-like protein